MNELTRARRIACLLYAICDSDVQDSVRDQFPMDAAWLGGDLDAHSDKEFVTSREAAELIGVTSGTIRNWASDGLLRRAGKRDRETVYRREEVEEIARSRSGESVCALPDDVLQ